MNKENEKVITPVIIEQVLLKIEDVRTLMFWTAQMTKGLLDSGQKEHDISDQIEKKYKSLTNKTKSNE